MSTLREDFEAWKKTMDRGWDGWDAYQAATERAAKLAEDARDASPVYRDEYDICNELAAAIRSGREAGS